MAVAEYRRNVTVCWNGWPACKLSKLSPADHSDMAVDQSQHDISQCWDGSARCDRSKLAAAELNALEVAAHQRNYLASLTGPSGCKLSNLTRRGQLDRQRRENSLAVNMACIMALEKQTGTVKKYTLVKTSAVRSAGGGMCS